MGSCPHTDIDPGLVSEKKAFCRLIKFSIVAFPDPIKATKMHDKLPFFRLRTKLISTGCDRVSLIRKY